MTKASLKAFNTYLASSNSPEWGTECVVGVITLSHALKNYYQENFKRLTMKNLEIMIGMMSGKDYGEGEWRVSDFVRHLNDYPLEGLKREIDKMLKQLHLKSGYPTTDTVLVVETSSELDVCAPEVDELDRSYFFKSIMGFSQAR